MTGAPVLLPLRVPELGPYLGRIVSGTGRLPGGLHLDSVRLRLATRVFEAAGEARRLASRENRRAAVEAVGRRAWLAAWEEAVASVGSLLMERVRAQLAAEARAVRLPRRRRRRILPNAGDARAATARLGAAGAGLVVAVDDVERQALHAVVATGLEAEAVAAWQDALRLASRRLEAAWLALEDEAEREMGRWQREADLVASWRRPTWPVLVVGVGVTAAALWLGLVFGGYIRPPNWLATFWSEVVR